MFFTVENAVDLHSVGSPLMLEMAVGGRHKDNVKEVSLCRSMTYFLTSSGRHLLGVSFLTSLKSNLCKTVTTENTTEKKLYVTSTKRHSTSSKRILNWNTSVTGHNQTMIDFPFTNVCAKVSRKLHSHYL